MQAATHDKTHNKSIIRIFRPCGFKWDAFSNFSQALFQKAKTSHDLPIEGREAVQVEMTKCFIMENL